MNVAEPFIKRPVATTLLVTTILIFGIMGYRLLPVSDLPTVDFPTIQVNAGLPGASPETMASAVALPLEKQFATIAGLNSINSTSGQGNTNITLQFDLSRNIIYQIAALGAGGAKTQSMGEPESAPAMMTSLPETCAVNRGDRRQLSCAYSAK